MIIPLDLVLVWQGLRSQEEHRRARASLNQLQAPSIEFLWRARFSEHNTPHGIHYDMDSHWDTSGL